MLKDNSAVALNQLEALSVISSTQAESIKKIDGKPWYERCLHQRPADFDG